MNRRLAWALAVSAVSIVGQGCGGGAASTSKYEGRVLVVQQAGDGGQPSIMTSAEFSERGQSGQAGGAGGSFGSSCRLSQHDNCQIEECFQNHLSFGGSPSASDVAGLGPLVAGQFVPFTLDGTLTVSAGGASYAYDSWMSLLAPRNVAATWTAGDAISAAWGGGKVPAFDATASFPPRVELTGPDLHDGAGLPVGHVVPISWTPPASAAPASAIVEATYAVMERSGGSIDFDTYSSITRCTAPLTSGSLTLTVPSFNFPANPAGPFGQIVVRVSNSVDIEASGPTSVHFAVASVEMKYAISSQLGDAGAD